jgi:hypothetical protein
MLGDHLPNARSMITRPTIRLPTEILECETRLLLEIMTDLVLGDHFIRIVHRILLLAVLEDRHWTILVAHRMLHLIDMIREILTLRHRMATEILAEDKRLLLMTRIGVISPPHRLVPLVEDTMIRILTNRLVASLP